MFLKSFHKFLFKQKSLIYEWKYKCTYTILSLFSNLNINNQILILIINNQLHKIQLQNLINSKILLQFTFINSNFQSFKII